MSHWLVELPLTSAGTDPEPQVDRLETTVESTGADLVDLQVSTDPPRIFAVFDTPDIGSVTTALTEAGLPHEDPAAVRLVGTTIDELRSRRDRSNWLVEWDLPDGLTMETYLERKAAKSPLYDDVPDVAFHRTWVREDMQKCLCFYDGPDEEAIRHARDVVDAPVDRLHRLDGNR